MNPLVSVLMPSYNCAQYIMESINSVKAQTYDNWELIIVNDGSTDSTETILASITDSRIRIITNRGNLGIAESRNIAIASSKGKYFAWLDSDDVATHDRLEKQVAFMESHDDFCFCSGNRTVIDASGVILENPVVSQKDLPLSWSLIWDNPVAQSSVMIRRSVFCQQGLKYSSKHAPSEDYNIWCQLALLGKMHRINDVILHYRVLESSALHKNRIRAMAMSLESNEAYVKSIVGSFADVHRFLTAFSWILPDRFAQCGMGSVIDWCDKLISGYIDHFSPGPREKRAVENDVYRVLLAKTTENWHLFFGAENRKAAARKSLRLFSSLMIKRTTINISKFIRSIAKAALHPFIR